MSHLTRAYAPRYTTPCLVRSEVQVRTFNPRTRLQRHSVSPAWRLDREIRRRLIRQETWFTRLRFFTSCFIDIDTFYLSLNWFSRRVSDDQKFLYDRRLYACINLILENSRASIPDKLRHCQISKKWFTPNVISIIAENKSHAHHKNHLRNESLQHPTIAFLLIKILIFFRPLSSVQLFQSNQHFQAIEFVDRHVSEKLLI